MNSLDTVSNIFLEAKEPSQISIQMFSNLVTFDSFEMMNIIAIRGYTIIPYVCVYRPHQSRNNNNLTTTQFREEYSLKQKRLILLGDFNVHFNKVDSPVDKLMDSNNWVQIVNHPTHRSGHIIDMVAIGQSFSLITD